jgi:hypothetical protein
VDSEKRTSSISDSVSFLVAELVRALVYLKLLAQLLLTISEICSTISMAALSDPTVRPGGSRRHIPGVRAASQFFVVFFQRGHFKQ